MLEESSYVMKVMSDLYFLDTNILVYAFDLSSPEKSEIAKSLITDGLRNSCAVISWQVAQEFLSLATRKFVKIISIKEANRILTDLITPMWRISPNAELYKKALEVHKKLQYTFYDSLIISSSISAGCEKLYTEDLQHGQRIGELEIINPFFEAN